MRILASLPSSPSGERFSWNENEIEVLTKDGKEVKPGDLRILHRKPSPTSGKRMCWDEGHIQILKQGEHSSLETADHHSSGLAHSMGEAHATHIHHDDPEGEHHANEHSDKHVHSFNQHHHTALRQYQDDPDEFNQGLRHGHYAHENHDHLEHVTGGHPTSRDHHVWRGVGKPSIMHHLKKGDVFQDHGFVSTSHKRSIADHFAKSHAGHEDKTVHRYMARIHLPKGTKAHSIRNGEFHEHEMLVHPSTKFHVMGHSKHEEQHSSGNKIVRHVIHLRAEN